MARTENITRYVCDRCGASAYLSADDPRRSDWRQIGRITADAVSTDRLLCAGCYADYRTLAVGQDNDFNQWMLNRKDKS